MEDLIIDTTFLPDNSRWTKFDFYRCHLSVFLLLIYSEWIHIQILDYVSCNHSAHKIEFLSSNSMLVQELVNIGGVDVDFAANLGEWDEALVAVVLPCFR